MCIYTIVYNTQITIYVYSYLRIINNRSWHYLNPNLAISWPRGPTLYARYTVIPEGKCWKSRLEVQDGPKSFSNWQSFCCLTNLGIAEADFFPLPTFGNAPFRRNISIVFLYMFCLTGLLGLKSRVFVSTHHWLPCWGPQPRHSPIAELSLVVSGVRVRSALFAASTNWLM